MQAAKGALAGVVLLMAAGSAVAQYHGEETFICESHKQRVQYCEIPGRGRAELVNQLSRADCIEGESWGSDRRGVWVSHGCRGEFALVRRGGRHDGGYYDGGGHGGQTILCESVDRRRAYCPVRIRRGAELAEQLSRGACIEGETWGYDRGGIWVSQGCRGEFSIY